jgi:hypothetical protein
LQLHAPQCCAPKPTIAQQEAQTAHPQLFDINNSINHRNAAAQNFTANKSGIAIPKDMSKRRKPTNLVHLQHTHAQEQSDKNCKIICC